MSSELVRLQLRLSLVIAYSGSVANARVASPQAKKIVIPGFVSKLAAEHLILGRAVVDHI